MENLPKNATMDFFLVLQQKKHHLYTCARIGMSTQVKKRLHKDKDMNAVLGMKTDFNSKSVNLGMISAMHTTIRQSFKKVTCPFKLIVIIIIVEWKYSLVLDKYM